MQESINTEKAPTAIGPYSQAVKAGNMLFVSGAIPVNPDTNEYVPQDVEAETRLVMANLQAVLEAGGASLAQVVKTSIFLKDMADFAVVNEVYGSYFKGNYPARETVQVAALPKGVKVEISCIAVL